MNGNDDGGSHEADSVGLMYSTGSRTLLVAPAHSLESLVPESTVWQRIFFTIMQLFWRNDGILPSPSSGGSHCCFANRSPSQDQEESLCHRYPDPPAHPGFASPHMVSNLCTSFQYGYFDSFPYEPISKAAVVLGSSRTSWSTQHTSAGVFHHSNNSHGADPSIRAQGSSQGCVFQVVSKGKPTKNSHRTHYLKSLRTRLS